MKNGRTPMYYRAGMDDHAPSEIEQAEETAGTLSGVVLARATINLPGLRAGTVEWVDAGNEYVQDCFNGGFLVLVDRRPNGGDPSHG